MANPKLKPNQFILPCGAMITERPILFSTDMVEANLEDRKTQTRRITKSLQKYCEKYNPKEFVRDEFREDTFEFFSISNGDMVQRENPNIKSPYGKPGDLIWVRETFTEIEYWDKIGSKTNYSYKADFNDPFVDYSPSIHMPKVASRIWVMVEDIRVERLQDLSEKDARSEGLCESNNPNISEFNITINKGKILCTGKHTFVWRALWISINGIDSWDSNPWVWVVKYRILSKSGKPSIDTIEKNYLDITGKEVVNA